MRADSRRTIRIRRLVVAVTVGVAGSFLPLPVFSFVPTASATTTAVTGLHPADAEQVQEQAAAIDDDHELDAARLVATETSAGEFSMIGAAFREVPTEPVMARVRSVDDGSWGEWFELEVSADDGPDPATAESDGDVRSVHTEPVWVDDSTGYELSVGDRDTDALAVTLVSERTERVVVDSTPLAESSPVNPIGVRLRSAWGARPSTTSTTGSLKLAVVHHTASTNNYSAAQVPSILRSTQAYHMDGRGWSDIAYNFLVDRFGTVWEGRGGGIDRAVIGAHAAGFNTGSVGISVIGNFVGAAVPPAVLERVSQVAGWRLGAYGIDPRSSVLVTSGGSTSIPQGQQVTLPRVVGHRDVGSTSCPGAIHASLPSVRNRAKQWADSYGNPVGNLDLVVVDGRRVTLRGWAFDPNTTSSIAVHSVAGGVWKIATASRPRADVAAAYPSIGANRGFEVTFTDVPPGSWNVCAYGINQGMGSTNSTLGCTGVVVK